MTVSLRHLRAFVAVAQVESFTIAAKNLCLTQSTLTKTIRELEQAVGLSLFERTTRKVVLTAHGNAFLPNAHRLLNDFELTLSDLSEQSAGSSGSVQVACGMAFASCVLPEVFKRLRKDFPGIHVRLVDDTSGGVLRRITSGEVDLGIASCVNSVGRTLDKRLLLTARLGVMFPPDYLLPEGPLTAERLRELPLLQADDDSSIMSALGAAQPELWQHVNSRVVVTNLDTQVCLIRAGIGPCVLSALAASHPFAQALPYRLIDEPAIKREVYIFTRHGVPLSPAALTFLQVLDEVLPGIVLHPGVERLPKSQLLRCGV
ncbi:LysR family transcriptional regulator [Chromobacterium violaceum]|uniref:LysR family transcriptional regulator n=1 Tax=Chromobacterium violaceum TaxID=536 RepID=UPI00143D3AB8|nr:LysR family transcriptional regulator [Chromobacterium violaceum]QIY78757.1 LysR family transcriptional regulator [Chromobacterium violaceum]